MNIRCLIVDDEPQLAEIAATFLDDLGYATIVCTDANDALAILHRRKDIDLLFTDVVMPNGLDGFELERRVLEMYPKCKVLLTSGFSGFVDGSQKGGSVPLSKPYGKADLARRVRQVLDAGRAP